MEDKKAKSIDALPYFADVVGYKARQLNKAETREERLWIAHSIVSWAEATAQAANEVKDLVFKEEGVRNG